MGEGNQAIRARNKMVDASMDAETLRQMIIAVEAQQGDHGYSQNSASVAALTGSGAVLASLAVSPKMSGKYRITGTAVFTNSAAATHNAGLLIQTGVGSAAVSTVSTMPTPAVLISNVTGGVQAVIQFELSAGLAVSSPGGSGVIQILGFADAASAMSVAIGAATLTVQEIL